jgi:hypothetical protein
MRNDYIKRCADWWVRFWGWVEFSGVALFTVLVKGADFCGAGFGLWVLAPASTPHRLKPVPPRA